MVSKMPSLHQAEKLLDHGEKRTLYLCFNAHQPARDEFWVIVAIATFTTYFQNGQQRQFDRLIPSFDLLKSFAKLFVQP
jgi:hypothetical protein